jgi:hypothetical protein
MRGREVSRLEALSDGMFAFAATLLVVSLEVPRTYPELVANLHGFLAFGVSFTFLLMIWWAHNRFFRRYGMQDTTVMVINSVLLFVVLFYVYPMKFMFSALAGIFFGLEGRDPVVLQTSEIRPLLIIYGLGFIAVFACFALLYLYAWHRRGELGLDALEISQALFWSRHYLIFAGVGALSVVLALLGIGVRFGFPGWIYCLIGPFCYWNGAVSGRRQRLQGLAAE